MDQNDEREGRLVRQVPDDTFGHRVLLSRAHAGHLTIDEAAKRCGLGAQNWSNWERGRMPRDILDVAESIAEGLAVDREWLLYGGQLTPTVKPRRLRATSVRRNSHPGVRRPRRVDGRRQRIAA